MPVQKLSAITTGTLAAATDSVVGVRSGATDLLLAPGTAAQVNTGTSGATIPLLNAANTWSALQTNKISDAGTVTITNVLIASHNTSGTAAASFGTGVLLNAQDSTTADQNCGLLAAQWTTATHGSATSKLVFQTVTTGAALATVGTLSSSGMTLNGVTPVLNLVDSGSSQSSFFLNGFGILAIAINRNPATGTFDNTGAACASFNLTCGNGTSAIQFFTSAVNNTSPTLRVTFDATGNIQVNTAGAGLQIKSGSNARVGTGTLSGGTLAVANTSVTASTRVFLTDTTSGSLTNVGTMTVVTSAGVGFTVTSSNVLDTSTFNWLLVESL